MNTRILAEIIADPTMVAELQTCTSVTELVAYLNHAGVDCTREEGLRFLRAWENVAADNETVDDTEPKTGEGGRFADFIRTMFRHDRAKKHKPLPSAAPPDIDTILNQMNRLP